MGDRPTVRVAAAELLELREENQVLKEALRRARAVATHERLAAQLARDSAAAAWRTAFVGPSINTRFRT